MPAFLIRRLLETVVALFLISSLIFVTLHLKAGGPCGAPSAGDISTGIAVQAPTVTKNCVDYYHLDEPVVDQYLAFVGNVVRGNLGTSLEYGGSVGSLLLSHLPATLLLITTAFLLQQLVALPLGILAAVRRYSLFDSALSVASYLFLSTPAFVLGLGLLYLFAVQWLLLPCCRASDVALPVLGTSQWFAMLPHQPFLLLGDALRHLILPAITLALIGIALDSRFMRAAMLQVLDEDYIRTARAKGLPRRTVIFKHAFRNALPPIITNMALYFPALIGSAMVVETVFSYTGIGYTFTKAIVSADAPVAQGVFILTTIAVLLANLAADLAYGVADPRVRYD